MGSLNTSKKSLFSRTKHLKLVFKISMSMYMESFESFHLTWLIRWKLWGVFVCGLLSILCCKLNFEVLYFTQFSIFFEKNKIIGYRLFIATLQPLGLSFFNSISKFLTILYFESFSISFYLLFFSYVLYNSKWSQNFQACSQIALKNEYKEAPPFWTFFHTNVNLCSAIARFFVGPKKGVLWIQKLISCNPRCGNFWNFFHMFSSQHTTRSYGLICPNMLFFPNFGTCIINDSFRAFVVKYSQGT